MKWFISNIIWDTDGFYEGELNLPNELEVVVDVPEDEVEDCISDWLSDAYGFCHYGFTLEKIG